MMSSTEHKHDGEEGPGDPSFETFGFDDSDDESDDMDFNPDDFSTKMLDACNTVFSVPQDRLSRNDDEASSKGPLNALKEEFSLKLGLNDTYEFEKIRKNHDTYYGDLGRATDLGDLLFELRQNGIQEAKIERVREAAKTKDLLKDHEVLQLAIYLYTTNSQDIQTTQAQKLYQALNESLANSKSEWNQFAAILLKALKQIPYEWGTVYRGTSAFGVADHYRKGNIVMWTGFVSTSKQKRVAKMFAKRSQDPIMFQIDAYSGRYIKEISQYPKEDEVLLPPMSLFEVLNAHRKKGILYVSLREYHMARGKKCILWVDDNPINNKKLMEKTESMSTDVNFVMLKSTESAMEFLTNRENEYLRKQDLSKFRIITDMTRYKDREAGAKFIRRLRDELNYYKEVLVFCGTVSYAEAALNKHKPRRRGKVLITKKVRTCLDYANFRD